MFLSKFQSIGRALFNQGLVSSLGGSLSMRMGDRIIITRRGCSLASLEEKDLIDTGITKNDRTTPMASVELPVHREIYQRTGAKAIVHAHPTHLIALSLTEKVIHSEPLRSICGMDSVPVLGWGMENRPGSLPDTIADILQTHHIVAIYGHGSFATGQLLEEAYNATTGVEEACKILCVYKSMQPAQPKTG